MAEVDALVPFNNDVIRGKTMKSVGFVLNEFSWIENMKPKPTTNIGTKGMNNLEMSKCIYDKSWRETVLRMTSLLRVLDVLKQPKNWQVSHCDMLCFLVLHLGAKSSYAVKETRDKVLNKFQSSFGTKFGLWRFWIRTCSFALSTAISISRDRRNIFLDQLNSPTYATTESYCFHKWPEKPDGRLCIFVLQMSP